MKQTLYLISIFILTTSFNPKSWGFFGHKRINRLAVFTLPQEMLPLFKTEIEYLTEHAVDPDRRRFVVPTEGIRHYINLDKWAFLPQEKVDAQILHTDIFVVGEKRDTSLLVDFQTIRKQKRDYYLKSKSIKKIFGRDSIVVTDSSFRRFFFNNLSKIQPDEPLSISPDSLLSFFKKEKLRPLSTAENGGIKAVFAKDKLSQHGILPYHLQTIYRQLVQAFVSKNKNLILKYAAELGHYLADAHIPLHTISNYDGQYSNQNGIHAFWESRLPELFADNQYDFFVGKAGYIEQPRSYFWNIINQSNRLSANTLRIEKEVSAQFEVDKKYCPEMVNGFEVQKQCFDFAKAYHDRLGGMVEEQMRRAILAVGSVWYSAWVDAGQPDLSNLKNTPLSKEEEKEQKEADEKIKNGGKILGRTEAY
ncbi:MAG: hypothetical protein JNL70_20940 [Saprospiraceae bacterium]|nr:hypothetical protein [Saprospiraceae bacterium]